MGWKWRRSMLTIAAISAKKGLSMKPQSIALPFAAALILAADPAFAGRAAGTVDGNTFDVELDCSD